MKKKKMRGSANIILSALFLAIAASAIREQLRREPPDRTWYGKVVGIPYDFRFPTAERLRTTFWNKNVPDLVVPQVFGIGWTINLYRIAYPHTEVSPEPVPVTV